MSKYQMTMEPKAKAVKFVIYGCEGIGKTTLASKLPNVAFIDTEGSTDHMTVLRYPKPQSWAELMDMVEDAKTLNKLNTLVIDTLDWADVLCTQSLCAKKQWGSIEDGGYGKGYVMLGEEFGKLLNKMNELIEIGINVGFTAHASLRKIEKPEETGAYDHWEMKCSKKVAPLVREWCDLMLFCNYDSVVIHGNNAMEKNKITGNKRVMYANHQPTFDAKNRFGLPDKMPLDYEQIRSVFERNAAKTQQDEVPKAITSPPQWKNQIIEERKPEPPKEQEADTSKPDIFDTSDPLNGIDQALANLMRTNNVTYEQMQKVVAKRGYYPADTPIEFYDKDFISGCLIACWEQIYKIIKGE